ncbi:TRAP transporter small permease [Halomonas sp.]|uniref:TRAP transporter small permease n=1 Tax=Halomonas sp. TaxID=1486246 RepID=UPI00260D4D52|nr:TRAP transporter small permease [Halomonas sp.]
MVKMNVMHDKPTCREAPSIGASIEVKGNEGLKNSETVHAEIGGCTGIKKGPLWRGVEILLFCGVVGMLVVVTLQVVARLTPMSLPWTEELTRYLFIWTTFLGLSVGTRSVSHARISLVIGRLPRLLQRVALHMYFVASCTFFMVLAYTGWRLVMQQFYNGETSPALGIGMYLITTSVVVSALLALWALVESVYLDHRTRSYLETGETIG